VEAVPRNGDSLRWKVIFAVARAGFSWWEVWSPAEQKLGLTKTMIKVVGISDWWKAPPAV